MTHATAHVTRDLLFEKGSFSRGKEHAVPSSAENSQSYKQVPPHPKAGLLSGAATSVDTNMAAMGLHKHRDANFAVEDATSNRIPSRRSRSSEDLGPIDAEMGDSGKFWPLPYMSNYVSVTAPNFVREFRERIKIENEYLLKRYYSSKKLINYAMHRHGSVASGSEDSTMHNERSKSYVWMNKFLDDSRYMAHLFESGSTTWEAQSGTGDDEEFDERHALRARAASSYFKYFQKLLTVDLRDPGVLKKHNLWIPTVKKGWQDHMKEDGNDVDRFIYKDKVSPLFIGGNQYIPKDYDLYNGSTSIPSLFSEYKLPAFVYHCSVEVNGKVYIMGGLMACHKHDDEAPSLRDFEVDGIKYLPPPLLSSVVNNPGMINNGRLYLTSVSSSSLRRPELSGHIPPPLLCMKGCKLTERHIFFYGGFEIRTETALSEHGLFRLKRRAYINNTGYILDVMTFNFTEVELAALPYKYFSHPTLSPRFGHMQISIPHNVTGSNPHTQRGCCLEEGMSSPSPSEAEHAKCERDLAFGSPGVSTAGRLNSGGHGCGVYSILIFGGYRQAGEDDYEAMNDLWRVDVPVLAKGKRGYFKFGSTANATYIPRASQNDSWPSPRAFLASCISNVSNSDNKQDLLERLQENFFIDPESFPAQERSKSIFKNLPRSRGKLEKAKYRMKSKDTNHQNVPSGDPSAAIKQHPTHSPCASPTTQPIVDGNLKSEQKVVIIHGGSDKSEVCSDMWWFDLDTETWTPVTIHGNSKSGMTPIDVGLVGHSLVCIGGMAVCIGGLLQQDVEAMYFGESYEYSKPELAIGGDLFNIFNLSSQCLLGHTVEGDGKSAILLDDPKMRSSMIFSFGCTVIHCNGDILLIGGLVSRRSDTRATHLRGAILKCVLPSMKLAS